MKISTIDNIKGLDNLREDWSAAYLADPYTTIHRSWSWLRGWVEYTPYDWLVIGLKKHSLSSYIAFLFLVKEVTSKNEYRLYMGGHPLSAHTGFVCVPEYTDQAIATFSNFIQKQLKWDVFEMKDVSDPRLDIFLNSFSSRKFNRCKITATPCPYISLPSTWDQYLRDGLSRSASKELKYKTRRIERQNGFRLIQAKHDNLNEQIETLLTLWQLRWGAKPEAELDSYRAIFRRCFEVNSLYLNILWINKTPVAARVGFVDRQKNVFSGFLSAWNNDFAKLSPGKVMFGYSIRYAIQNGFSGYDFGRGNSDYKFTFGAKERFNKNVIIVRNDFRKLLISQSNIIKRKTKIAREALLKKMARS